MTNNPIIWFEIYVQDIARAKKFFGSFYRSRKYMIIYMEKGKEVNYDAVA